MPQKLNKAGKMQDYIPKGNGDASGEYGTSNGTNKNFTTSDKKSSKANVITENKSVVVGDKGKTKDYTITKESIYNKKNDKNFDYDVIDKLPDGWGKIDGALTAPKGYVWVNNKKSLWDKDYQQAIIKKELLESNKANVIDSDLSGKKEEVFNNLMKGKGSIEDLKQVKDNLKINDASFTTNYNSVKNQEAIYENGNEKISFRFTTDYNPQMNTGTPQKPIKTTISSVLYKNGNAVGVRVIEETNTKSYKNAEKQYNEMMNKWKEATGQKNISWK